jgi:hypothetical protein
MDCYGPWIDLAYARHVDVCRCECAGEIATAVCGLRSRPKGQLAFLFKAKRVGWIEPHGLEVN